MSAPPVTGTFRLDGMLQGPLPPDAPVIGDLENWTASAKKNGLFFHLTIDGGSFSIVADPSVQKTSKLAGRDLDDLLEDALNSFLEFLPPAGRTAVFSTVRSEEFRPGTAVQTLYTVGSDGGISSEQRMVDADTEDPPPELTAASIRRAAIPVLLALFLGLFISSFFIDYRKLFSDARDRVAPLAKEEVTIKQSALGKFVDVELAGVDTKRNALLFKLKRGSEWDHALSSKPSDNASDWPTFLMQSAIHQRRLRVELFNKDGQLLSQGEIRLDALHARETAEVAVVAKLADRLATVVIRP